MKHQMLPELRQKSRVERSVLIIACLLRQHAVDSLVH